MTDDIVARLRVLAAEFPTFNGIMDSEWTNAADEIERLRKERDDARWRLCKVLGDIRDVWGDEIAIEKGWSLE